MSTQILSTVSAQVNPAETHIKTPRGTIRYAFDTLEQAQADGWSIWFQHGEVYLVTKDNLAVAVRAQKPTQPAAESHPYTIQRDDRGWTGCNHDSNLRAKDIAAIFRKHAKTAYPSCVFSVTTKGHSSINISLMQAPFCPWVNLEIEENRLEYERRQAQNEYYTHDEAINSGNRQLNHNCIEREFILSPEAKAVLADAAAFMKSYNYDNSDMMMDYFDTGFYLHMEIGKWNKPFMRTAESPEVAAAECQHINNEDLTVLELGPANEEYNDTLQRLEITEEEAREIVSESADRNAEYAQESLPLKVTTGARCEDLHAVTQAFRAALRCLYRAHILSHRILPKDSGFAIFLIDELEMFISERCFAETNDD